jgi:hypothetical protein
MGYFLMSYALVIDGTIEAEGPLPSSARRLDTGAWVMGLATAPVELQQATGWYEVTDTPRPADTATDTFDRTLELVGTTPTVVWVQRPKTAEELTAATEATNQATIQTNLEQDLAAMQATIDATNASINSNVAPHVKAIARAIRRLTRTALGDYSGDS